MLDKPALIRWANKQGLAGIDTTVKVKRAADIGTVGHARIEAHLRGMELDESNLDHELVDKSANAFLRFLEWWDKSGLEVKGTEIQMISEAIQVGGTMDILAASKEGKLVLVDIKTSGGIYREMRLQASAYAGIYEEISGAEISDVLVARVGKEEQDTFEFEPVPNWREGFLVFSDLAKIYRALQAFEKGKA
jgi:hypothetical protein